MTPNYNCATLSSSTDCVITVVDNPNLDFILVLLLFTIWVFGTYWMFSKKR